ncbi:Protein TIME FOR COFFEE [Vitis vinifera]|uniref:Protein TIME FOR COFFEE n=1 Tax=Vitis vinifera TaxID=29760 RepID=A0A438F4E0_VITVI|nr:Protein TIME FOR COFFEE [Vitis vinifera]
MSLEPQKQAIKPEELKPLTKESGGSQDGIVTKEKPVLPKVSSTKLDVDLEDSQRKKRISTVSEVESRQEEKFKIDLMAPPPMALSPERDGLTGLVSDPNLLAQDVEMKKEIVMKVEEKVEKTVKKEAVGERIEEKKTEIVGDKHESPRLDFDKEHESGNASSTKLQQQGQKQQSSPKASIIPKEDKTAQSSSLTLPIAVTGWPGGLPPLGVMIPFPPFVSTSCLVSMDGSSGSSTAVQPPHYPLSIPRPKRCATHQYIARNIYYHQQLTRMNPFWSAAAGSASLYGVAKPYNLNFMPPTENMILGSIARRLSRCEFKLQTGQRAGYCSTSYWKREKPRGHELHGCSTKKTACDSASPTTCAACVLKAHFSQRLMLWHAPAFIIPLSQHQAAVAATSNPSGPAKSATSSAKHHCLNNGYPFPISTHVGAPPPLRGGTQSQAMPCFNGTFYSSQMFHPSQLHQQQPHSQPLVQQANQNTSASSGSSSSNKHPQTQQLRGTQISGNNFLTPTTMQSQQLQKQHVPSSHQSRKRDVELCGENTQSAVDARASHIQKNVYGQNFAVPVPPVNFALMPSATLAGGGNPGEKQPQHQSQQQGLKGGVELIPSQAFAMSFASFNGSNTASGINFSSMAQNPVIFQSLPDMVRHGYQVAPAAQMTQQKNYQISEGKIGNDSSNAEDGRKTIPGKSSNVGQSFNSASQVLLIHQSPRSLGTTVFDGSTRTLNFVSSPANLNRPSRTTTSPVAANGRVNSSS